MQVGTQDGWLGLPMSPVRALMGTSLMTLGTVSPAPPSRRPDSLATKLALSTAFYLLNTSGNTNGGGKGKNPHTNHPRSPTVYNTLKRLVPLAQIPAGCSYVSTATRWGDVLWMCHCQQILTELSALSRGF